MAERLTEGAASAVRTPDSGKPNMQLTPRANRLISTCALSEPMTEAATVFWYSIEMFEPEIHATISRGRDRKFESVENAVRFVMETLPDEDRATAIIQTDIRSIQIDDIVAIYGGLEANAAPLPKG